MKAILILVTLFFTVVAGNAQNLVPNPSFEEYTTCPSFENQIVAANYWKSFGNTPDYFNSCDSLFVGVPSNEFGFQQAYDGHGYCGLYTFGSSKNYREFVGTNLIQSLTVGTKYFVSMKVSLADFANCASNNFGITFSNQQFSETLPPVLNGQAFINSSTIIADMENWIVVSGTFIADSPYQYILIGNLYSDSLTYTLSLSGNPCNAYYFIDDVCVSTDSLTCDLNSRISSAINDVGQIYPNPTNDFLKIKLTEPCDAISLFDDLGREVFKNRGPSIEFGIDVSEFQPGIYIVEIRGNDRVRTRKITILK